MGLGSSKSSYKDVGIDIEKIRKIQNFIGSSIKKTHSLIGDEKVISGYGHYAGLIDMGNQIITLHTDGVGSKILVAQQMNKFDTIGIDCIAMNVNDIVCMGSKPVGYVSYIALQKTNESLLKEITKGLVKGAKLSNMAIVGGETAILPEIITGAKENYNFDLAGMVLGVIKEKRKIVTGNNIKSNDIIIGIQSSGLHSNGYSLARKVLLEKYSLNEKTKYIKNTIGLEMLKPTIIYSTIIQKVLMEFGPKIHGLAHITGGAFTKLKRLNSKVDFVFDSLPTIEGLFKQIMLDGNIDFSEMYRTFNMGIGFCIIAPKNIANDIMELIKISRLKSQIIGKIKANGNGSSLICMNNKMIKI